MWASKGRRRIKRIVCRAHGTGASCRVLAVRQIT